MVLAVGAISKTLSLLDQSTGKLFLVDSGADLSVFPASGEDKLKCHSSASLVAANGSSIGTYGTKTINLCFPGGLHATQSFTLADVDHPILGVDFFRDHNLDCYGEVFPFSVAIVSNSLASLRPMNERCSAVLDKFPEILQPRFGSFRN